MRLGLLQRTFLLSSLVLGGAALAYGCTLDSEGQADPDASLGGSGGTGIGGSGGTTNEAGPDQDTPDIGSPDVPCFYPNKICDGVCVNFDDPDHGCAQGTCDPCESYPNSTSVCVNNECLPKCNDGWASCDADPTTGCETDIHSIENCGACGVLCTLPNATEQCDQGTCGIDVCDNLWGDCNNNESDGCETNLRTLEDCGSCGNPCSLTNPTCASGTCIIDNCPAGSANCNGDQTTCETNITTTANCGGCGSACTGPNVQDWSCDVVGGVRTCVIVTCAAGWENCDNVDANGCEVNRLVSVDNCGQCGGVCAGTNTQSRACINGLCDPTCNSGYEDCNGPEPGISDNGCETVVSSDVNACGSCTNVCNLPHANEVCQSGNCGIQSCESGWGNCDSNVPNGCETNLLTSPTHCGSCTNVCSSAGGTPTCNNGSCNISCAAGRGNCDGDASNGCETDLTTVTNCGACGKVCSSVHGTPSCNSGQCAIACTSGYADCDGNVDTGCEITLNTDPNHCGACPNLCSANHIPTTVCTSGVCTGACQSGYDDCNSNKLTDGCEVNLTSTPTSCGACTNNCSTNHVQTVSCSASVCDGPCSPGYADCNSNKLTDGCETGISSNVTNCGGCGKICSNNHIPTPTCSSGICNGTCAAGYGDCNSNKLTDGCETDTNTAVLNCGSCGHSCNATPAPPHASWQCQTGLCEPNCDSNFTDCDDVDANGCECPSQFNCTGGLECKCDADSDCGATGEATCNNGSGLCTCTSSGGTATPCAVGQVCDGSGGCK